LFARFALCAALAASIAGCGPDYSPDTYATNAVQQANKVDQGVIAGVREVGVSASGTNGAMVGGAAGGVAGSQVGSGAGSAFGALGGALVGGIAGSAAEHVVGDTRAFEYIVRKPSGDLLSVTQKDTEPLRIGQKVLVIAGNQARVVPDYTVAVQAPPKQTAAAPQDTPTTRAGSSGSRPRSPRPIRHRLRRHRSQASAVAPAPPGPTSAAGGPPVVEVAPARQPEWPARHSDRDRALPRLPG
jgi:outer membrane lipoprotein SlyB